MTCRQVRFVLVGAIVGCSGSRAPVPTGGHNTIALEPSDAGALHQDAAVAPIDDGSGSADDSPHGGYGYGAGGYGAGGIRTGWASTEIHIGKATASAGLDPLSIRRILKDDANELKLCYEHELDVHSMPRVKPTFQGTSTATFTIELDGRISKSRAAGFDAKVDACVAKAIKNMTFAKPAATTVDVTIPFTFRPPSKTF